MSVEVKQAMLFKTLKNLSSLPFKGRMGINSNLKRNTNIIHRDLHNIMNAADRVFWFSSNLLISKENTYLQNNIKD